MHYNKIFALLLLTSLCLLSCSHNQVADRIYINAKIWTGDSLNDRATSLAIKDSLIINVGNDYSKFQGSQTQVIDMEGKMIVPGFIDNHTHFLAGGYQLASVNLRNVKSKSEFITMLKTFVSLHNDNRWVLGGDWDHEAWGGYLPTREWIDSISGNHPIFVNRYDGHMSLANSLALKLAGITKDTPIRRVEKLLRIRLQVNLLVYLKMMRLTWFLPSFPPLQKRSWMNAWNAR